MEEYREITFKELETLELKLDTGEENEWFSVFLYGREGLIAQFLDEQNGTDEEHEIRIELDDIGKKTISIKELLSIQIENGEKNWCPVFVNGRNGVYCQFFNGEDIKDENRNLRMKIDIETRR